MPKRSRLSTASSMAPVVLVLLLTIHPYLVYAGTTAHTVTAYGNAQIDTAQSKFGGASGLFDGDGDYLSTPDSADLRLTNVGTLETWIRIPSTYNVWGVIVAKRTAGTAAGLSYELDLSSSGRNLRGLISDSINLNIITGGSTLAFDTWYHAAFVWDGSYLRLFLNGVSDATPVSQTLNAQSANHPVEIGRGVDASPTYYKGRLDELRISNTARWTSNFTPPTSAYTADSPTVLLLHMNRADGSTTFIDDSAVPGPDFSINASPTSQSVGAGSTASFTLTLNAFGGFSGTVSLSVTSGAPPGVTCTITPDTISIFPGTATLSVPTLITTSGTYSIVVTGTCASPSITHTVTVTLTVTGPASYSFNVKAGATQIVVTLTYSWSGAGSPPQGSIAIAGPGGTPTLQESAAVTYDRTSITVSGSTTTYSIIHRATFTIAAPGSTQTWTALISMSGVSNYNVTVEVS